MHPILFQGGDFQLPKAVIGWVVEIPKPENLLWSQIAMQANLIFFDSISGTVIFTVMNYVEAFSNTTALSGQP